MEISRVIELLRGTEFFRGVTDDVLEDLANRCEARALAPHEQLFAEGEPGDALFIVSDGRLELFASEAHLDTAGPGACVGELALFGGWPRSASARAGAEETTVLRADRAALGEVMGRHGDALSWGIFRELAAKLRSSIRVRVEQHGMQQRLRDAFAKSVSGDVMERLLAQVDPADLLEGREGDASVLFLDIRDSTTITERLSPPDVIRFVNTFIGPLVDLVIDGGGVIERFTGDGFKACFGVPLRDPTHAVQATECALRIRERVLELNELHRGDFPIGCRVGTGISSGRVVTGCIGNARRLAFTVGGDTANTAARVEGLTKSYRTDLLITGRTIELLPDSRAFRRVDVVRVKGKTTSTELFDAAPRDAAHVAGYAAALEEYRRGDFASAAHSFGVIARTHPDDGPATVLAERCGELAAAPPPAWDGAFEHRSK